jgi:hypothetical protein
MALTTNQTEALRVAREALDRIRRIVTTVDGFARSPSKSDAGQLCADVEAEASCALAKLTTALAGEREPSAIAKAAGELVARLAQELMKERIRLKNENDANLARYGLWPDHHFRPTDEQVAAYCLDFARRYAAEPSWRGKGEK